MTKHGVIGLVTSPAPSLGAVGVPLFALCPGGVETGMVPPDLREKRTREGSFSSPGSLAEEFMRILDMAQPGESGWRACARSLISQRRWRIARTLIGE